MDRGGDARERDRVDRPCGEMRHALPPRESVAAVRSYISKGGAFSHRIRDLLTEGRTRSTKRRLASDRWRSDTRGEHSFGREAKPTGPEAANAKCIRSLDGENGRRRRSRSSGRERSSDAEGSVARRRPLAEQGCIEGRASQADRLAADLAPDEATPEVCAVVSGGAGGRQRAISRS